MPLPRHIFAPAFRQQKLGLLYALLIGIMVYLASFATAAEATLSMTTFTWNKSIGSKLTVEIPAVDEESSTPQSERVTRTLAVLRAMPAVANVTMVPEDETARLLKPWIDRQELLKDLPIPALIDVERKDDSLTAADVQSALKNIVSDAHVEDHAAWLGELTHLTRGLSLLSALIILLTGATLIIAMSLLCRTIMATEHEAISLLHVMGANDDDIARHFQFHARRMAVPAALGGFTLAILTAVPFLFFLHNFTDLLSMQPIRWISVACAAVLAPLVAIWIAALSARLSALRILHGMS